MKTAKPPAADGAPSLSRRAQPVRQTRINPPRTSSLNRGNSFQSGPAQEQPIDIFPAVTHFTDAISALPKELVRHFTLLKEVDAKIFAPEAALFQLLDAALKAPAPDAARSLNDASSSVAPGSTPMSAQNSSFGAAVTTNTHTAPSHDGSTSAAAFDDSNMPRRQLFRQTAYKIQEMLVSLEEKNHVISTANDAMHKQLGRIEEIWPHLESEFSEEAKWGSTTHWAYAENRQAKTNNAQAEKSRREGAATLSAAAQQLAEEAAARSSDRKQALAAKKNSKNNAADAEAENKPQESGKKSQGSSKSRKPPPAEPVAPVGLGIAPVPPSAAPAPSKRRKVESAKANGGAPMERAMSTVFGSNTSKPKTTSPRETPAPETAGKKRKALPTSGSQAKKSKTNAAMSPSVVSSPLVGTFPESAKIARNSPVPPPQIPAAPARPASSRARQSSTQSNNVVENARQRPASAASNKPNGALSGTHDVVAQSNGATKTNTDPKSPKEAVSTAPSTKIEPVEKPKIEVPPPPPPLEPVPNGGKEASTAKAVEERELKKETTTPVIPPPAPTATVKTKSGRASKPSTPALATFAEAASAARSRPSRNNAVEGNGGSTTATMTAVPTKRSHKKGASSVSAVAAAAAMAAQQQVAAAAAAPVTSVTPVPIPAAAVQDVASNNGAGNNNTSSIINNKSHNTSSNAVGGPGANASTNPYTNVNSNTNSNNHNKSATGAQDDDDDADVDELRYCYCNGVSYGEMVACDGEGCPREWFHLECVGLKVAPKLNAKWYCEDCKRNLRGSERR
ncbi:hypothetical protein B0T26DRAFT_680315 [Lasiosphaeria miniovina]|uniref:Chromatin modification-related protein n=1 Tax=Lasiosphaeria miniovina TaxID=1954250 RepID=A0AA39ZZT0_9PEZI|nr:uncharacterized protein B0T26DRAFT_680315 [Lasiosphaeria miniovina]KAK0706663.1 hypothetical protein B0T26DRAFT_680315 [Lasiosphaeria miniovina]